MPKYIGLQDGDNCFCGNSYGKFGKGNTTSVFEAALVLSAATLRNPAPTTELHVNVTN
jgi:hypothetical protein